MRFFKADFGAKIAANDALPSRMEKVIEAFLKLFREFEVCWQLAICLVYFLLDVLDSLQLHV